jgi:salicylate hydroxylase
MSTSGREIAIVGAGIGGLSAAIALTMSGHKVSLYERANELAEVGAGIQMSPNATRIFDRLGLLAALGDFAVRPLTGDLRRWEDWSLLARQPLGDAVADQFGAPYFHLHRADLLRVLANNLDTECLHTGYHCVGVEHRNGRVDLSFTNGERVSHDVVIGADGIHSVIRAQLFGPAEPRFSGGAAWRGVVPTSRIRHLNIPVASTAVLGPDSHLVHYYLRRGELLNWVGISPTESWTDESWTAQGTLADALDDFGDWAPTVRSIIEAVGDAPIYRWALYDRDPLPRWSDGRVTLLGDACHPMLPFMAQGAAQSIEDAAVLTRCLTEITDIELALATYERQRRERTALVQTKARENGQMFHLPDGADQLARDAALANPKQATTHRNAWLFDYDVDTLVLS